MRKDTNTLNKANRQVTFASTAIMDGGHWFTFMGWPDIMRLHLAASIDFAVWMP